jgi:hypothetical protein
MPGETKMQDAMRSITITLLFTVLSTSALAGGVDGTWNAAVESDFGAVSLLFVFRSDGDRVTGTVSAGGMHGTEIRDGRIVGNRLTFNLPWGAAPDRAPLFSITYEATIDGDEMDFVSSFPAGPEGERMVTEFKARRASD